MRNLLVAAAVIGVGGYFGAKLYVQHKTARDLDALLAQVRPFVDVGYGNVVATLDGELRVERIAIRLPQFKDPIAIESVGVLTPGFLFLLGFDNRDLEFPERLGLKVHGLRLAVDADFMRMLDDYRLAQAGGVELTAADECASTYGLTPVAMKRFGYHEVVVDFTAAFRRQADALVVDVATHVEDMYDFDVSLTLGGVADPAALARGVKPLLVSGRLDYVDRSLNERVRKHCAERQVAAEDVLAAQLREVQTLARSNGIELDAMIMDPYTDFLRGKRRFTITSQPVRPVDLTRISLYKPADVPNLLNLAAEAG